MSTAQRHEVRPELLNRFEDGRTFTTDLSEAMSLSDGAGALKRRWNETPMCIDDVGWRRIGHQPGQVQYVTKGTDRTPEFDPMG
jgi:hypothetical protein